MTVPQNVDQRYYTSQFGRFLSADRSKQAAKVNDSGSWNKYAYAEDDPVNANDPSGLASCKAVGSTTTYTDPDNALSPVTTVEIQCTSKAGSVYADQYVTFKGGASPGDINNALQSLGATVDTSEHALFEALLSASKARLAADLSNPDCATAIGASSVAAAEAHLGFSIDFKDLGELKVTVNPDGSNLERKGSAPIARYFPVLGFRNIRLNSELNWADPSNTWVYDQNGIQVLSNELAAEALYLGISSVTAAQYMDIILLHELAHTFGADPDSQRVERDIFTKCIH